MGKGGFINYKCRRCGHISSMLHVPDVTIALIREMRSMPHPEPGGCMMSKFELHYCEDGKVGIADLIGGTFDAN